MESLVSLSVEVEDDGDHVADDPHAGNTEGQHPLHQVLNSTGLGCFYAKTNCFSLKKMIFLGLKMFWVKYCHTRLHLGFSAKLTICQVPAYKW